MRHEAIRRTASKSRTPAQEAELERLIREQRDDQRQDITGLRSTVLGDALRGIGVADDAPARRRRPRPGKLSDE